MAATAARRHHSHAAARSGHRGAPWVPYMVCLSLAVGVDGALEADQCRALTERCHRARPVARQIGARGGKTISHAEWSCGLMDKALVLGTKDCRFESCQGHVFMLHVESDQRIM